MTITTIPEECRRAGAGVPRSRTVSQRRHSALHGRMAWARAIAIAVLGQHAVLSTPVHADSRAPSASQVGTEVICAGDCNYDGQARIEEVVTGVNIVLSGAGTDGCAAIDADGNGTALVNDLVAAVVNALRGCPTARFVATDCHVPPPDGQDPANVRCGDVIVPENRAARNGRTVRLAVEVLKATGAVSALDPFVVLSGGPGQRAIDGLVPLQTAEFAAPIQAQRDFVIFDPRGVGYSQPALECPELAPLADAFGELRTPAEEVEREAAGFLACRARLATEGHDLAAYSSAATVQDLAGIMEALGYEQYNLYGFSYGTRVALTALRDLPPGRIRSVVLDSVAPLEVDLSLGLATPTADALERVFADCAAQAQCAGAYPNLRQTFFDLVDRLNANPPTVESMTFDGQPFTAVLTGDRFVTAVSTALQDAGTALYLPLLIAAASAGDGEALSNVASLLAVSGTGFDSAGLTATIICNEEDPFVTPADIDAQNESVDPRIRRAFVNPDLFGRICPSWGSPEPAAAESAPVRSDVPALVLAGGYDSSTPPAWSRLAAASLSHSTYAEFRGFGHVVIGQYYSPTGPPSCAIEVITQFLDDPTRPPETACVDALPPPPFVTL